MAAGICHDAKCLMCDQQLEINDHLFFQCLFSRKLCIVVMGQLGINFAAMESLYDNWKKQGRSLEAEENRKCVHTIWCARNYKLWNKATPRPDQLVNSIKKIVYTRVNSFINSKWTDEEIEWVHSLNL